METKQHPESACCKKTSVQRRFDGPCVALRTGVNGGGKAEDQEDYQLASPKRMPEHHRFVTQRLTRGCNDQPRDSRMSKFVVDQRLSRGNGYQWPQAGGASKRRRTLTLPTASGRPIHFSQRNLPEEPLFRPVATTLVTPGIPTCSNFKRTSVAGTR